MCQDCGCTSGEVAIVPPHTHPHSHDPSHRAHSVEETPDASFGDRGTEIFPRKLAIAEGILSKNDRFARENREHFKAHELLVLNILSSPGSGKTSLIERTARDLNERAIGVIVGDLATDRDAERLRASGAAAIQIVTGTACHLEADSVARAAKQLDLDATDILIIENVGNLVCPAAYDLGESLRVALLSVTEGEDKPLKYPTAFKSADAIVISKIDLAEAVEFDRDMAFKHIRQVAPQAIVFEVSARTGQGMAQWYEYLEQHALKKIVCKSS